MGRSIRHRTALTFAVACTALGVFAGTAGASNHGASGFDATHSCGSAGGGIANAAFSTPAGYQSASYTTTNAFYPPFFVGYPYDCVY
jgi:NhaP-type Na+/H+ or K+/H+ antiporter